MSSSRAVTAAITGRLGAALAFAAALAMAEPAWAQGMPGGGRGFGPPGGFAPPSGSSSKKKAAKKPEDETHAASNTEAQQSLQTQEPQLPQNPNEIPKEMREKIGTDFARDLEKGRGPTVERDFYGLYYQERSGGYRFRTIIPPLWMERTMPEDRASIFGFYYNRRGKDHDADVLFPFFWKLRDENVKTTVVLPFVHREAEAKKDAAGKVIEPGRHDNWLVPLAFSGESDDGSGYFHVPPLLTVTKHSARGGLNIAGPMFCRWKGGPACDRRTADVMDLGLAPFYFFGKDEKSEYEIIPPLIHYYKYSEIGDKSTNVWGPVLLKSSPDEQTVDVLPFFYRSWGKNEASTTLLPLFHYQYKGDSHLLVTPLFVTARGEDKSETIASWVYARYRGRTELDMYTPLYWQYRDPDIGLDRKLLVPFFYKNDSPRSHDTVVFPFYAHLKRAGISDQTWITPLFRHVGDVTGWETDLFPFFWFGRKNDTTHTIAAPFFWDFASPHSRITVAAPLFVRIADDKGMLQIAGNTFYREKQVPGGTEWEFHFFPIFSYGQSPTGHWWNVLYGLAGYTHDGTTSKLRTFYIPITMSE